MIKNNVLKLSFKGIVKISDIFESVQNEIAVNALQGFQGFNATYNNSIQEDNRLITEEILEDYIDSMVEGTVMVFRVVPEDILTKYSKLISEDFKSLIEERISLVEKVVYSAMFSNRLKAFPLKCSACKTIKEKADHLTIYCEKFNHKISKFIQSGRFSKEFNSIFQNEFLRIQSPDQYKFKCQKCSEETTPVFKFDKELFENVKRLKENMSEFERLYRDNSVVKVVTLKDLEECDQDKVITYFIEKRRLSKVEKFFG